MRVGGLIMEFDLHERIKDWWGEPLSPALVQRIVQAPPSHLREFVELFEPRGTTFEVAAIPTGELRPIVLRSGFDVYERKDRYQYLNDSMLLLLYVHKVLVGDPIAALNVDDKFEVETVFTKLLALAPMMDLGIVRFVTIDPKHRHPSRSHRFIEFDETWARVNDPLGLQDVINLMIALNEKPRDYELSTLLFRLHCDIGSTLNLASKRPNAFHQLVRCDEEWVVHRMAILHAASASQGIEDLRLRALTSLKVPNIVARGKSLMSLRTSAEEFADWRSALSRALVEIDSLRSADENWELRINEIVYTELEAIRERLNRIARQSTGLASVTEGAKSLTFAGIGAAAGATMGASFFSGLVGAATAKAAEVGVAYLNSLRERRRAKAVLDLILSFKDG